MSYKFPETVLEDIEGVAAVMINTLPPGMLTDLRDSDDWHYHTRLKDMGSCYGLASEENREKILKKFLANPDNISTPEIGKDQTP